MERHELTPLVEALLFSAEQPLTASILAKIVDDKSVTAVQIKQVLDALAETYEASPRGFKVMRFGNAYQVVTRERYAPWVQALVAGKRQSRLTRAGLETAAVIAYKQPITRLGIEQVRGVDVGGVLNTLLERGLIMIKGRDPGPGRPLLYGTTQSFLDYFGLSSVGDLPRLDEIAALGRSDPGPLWDDRERQRMERHGVEPDQIPFPGEGEGEPGEESLEEETTEPGSSRTTGEAVEEVREEDIAPHP